MKWESGKYRRKMPDVVYNYTLNDHEYTVNDAIRDDSTIGDHDLRCLECGGKMDPVRSGGVIWYFRHPRGESCLTGKDRDENTLAEREGRRRIMNNGFHKHWQDKFEGMTEKTISIPGKGKRRADILIEEIKLVIEIQHSAIKPEIMKQRTADYESCGYTVMWILDDWWTEEKQSDDGRTMTTPDIVTERERHLTKENMEFIRSRTCSMSGQTYKVLVNNYKKRWIERVVLETNMFIYLDDGYSIHRLFRPDTTNEEYGLFLGYHYDRNHFIKHFVDRRLPQDLHYYDKDVLDFNKHQIVEHNGCYFPYHESLPENCQYIGCPGLLELIISLPHDRNPDSNMSTKNLMDLHEIVERMIKMIVYRDNWHTVRATLNCDALLYVLSGLGLGDNDIEQYIKLLPSHYERYLSIGVARKMFHETKILFDQRMIDFLIIELIRKNQERKKQIYYDTSSSSSSSSSTTQSNTRSVPLIPDVTPKPISISDSLAARCSLIEFGFHDDYDKLVETNNLKKVNPESSDKRPSRTAMQKHRDNYLDTLNEQVLSYDSIPGRPYVAVSGGGKLKENHLMDRSSNTGLLTNYRPAAPEASETSIQTSDRIKAIRAKYGYASKETAEDEQVMRIQAFKDSEHQAIGIDKIIRSRFSEYWRTKFSDPNLFEIQETKSQFDVIINHLNLVIRLQHVSIDLGILRRRSSDYKWRKLDVVWLLDNWNSEEKPDDGKERTDPEIALRREGGLSDKEAKFALRRTYSKDGQTYKLMREKPRRDMARFNLLNGDPEVYLDDGYSICRLQYEISSELDCCYFIGCYYERFRFIQQLQLPKRPRYLIYNKDTVLNLSEFPDCADLLELLIRLPHYWEYEKNGDEHTDIDSTGNINDLRGYLESLINNSGSHGLKKDQQLFKYFSGCDPLIYVLCKLGLKDQYIDTFMNLLRPRYSAIGDTKKARNRYGSDKHFSRKQIQEIYDLLVSKSGERGEQTHI